MPINKCTEGTGMTAQPVIEVSMPFGDKELKLMEQTLGIMGGTVDGMTHGPFGAGELWAVETLKVANLPTDGKEWDNRRKNSLRYPLVRL